MKVMPQISPRHPEVATSQVTQTPQRARHMVAVLESQSEGASFHRLRLAGASIVPEARPGQFVHVLPRLFGAGFDVGEGYDPLLRRAFSIMGTSASVGAAIMRSADGEKSHGDEWFEILFRVGGRGTSILSRCRAGDVLDVLGPLGNGFDLGAPSGMPGQRPLLLVGGGIGMPPLIFAAQVARRAQQLMQREGASVSRETNAAAEDESRLESFAEVFVGARTAHELVGVEALRAVGVRVHITTDDGSEGRAGLVIEPLRERLEELERAKVGEAGVGAALVCACGPWPMLKAVALLCARMKVECRVSMEEAMPCGVGVCNGCVVPVLGASDDYGRLQRICVQGPVLDALSVDWGEAEHATGEEEEKSDAASR